MNNEQIAIIANRISGRFAEINFKQQMKKQKPKTAGRKPIEDKKQRIILYIRQSKVNEKGGEEKLKQFLYGTL